MKQSRDAEGIRNSVQVFLDEAPQAIGTFYPNYNGHHGTHAFAYSREWLEDSGFFDLDPQLQPWEGEQFAPPSLPMLGALADATPQRWGRRLLDRWEAVCAELEKRPARTLDDADYLLAVQDATRMGALRFSRREGDFLGKNTSPIPKLTDLRSLAEICFSIDSPESEQHGKYPSRLARLVSAAASLGGARPKVSFLESNQLWIAKFPSEQDEFDVGAWEFLLNQLARNAGILVPNAKLMRLEGPHRTFCAQRFDRVGASRKMYASAMTCLQRQDGDDEVGYLDIAEFMTTHVAKERVKGQLEQLFRRVVFNVLMNNRDDHLRNHGFLRGELGWELSPAFDMNPSWGRKTHAIKIDAISPAPDINRVIRTAEVYQLTRDKAASLLDEVASAVSCWYEEALRLRISRQEIQMMQGFLREPWE